MQYQELLENMVQGCKRIFEANLTGIYLHGSLAMGCFNPKKSDIDLIIVIEKDITDEQKLAFMQVVVELNKQAPHKGIELSVVKREYCQDFVYPTPYELHFSNTHLQWFKNKPLDYIAKMTGTDKDLAAHFTIINKCGITLWGEEIASVFGQVPKADYIDSIRSDVENAGEEILENPIYMTLNLCRVAAYLEENLVISKKQGGQWGLQNLEPKYHSLIAEALECYASEKQMAAGKGLAQEFAVELMKKIEQNEITI